MSRNIALTIRGYFEADEEIRKYKHQKYNVPAIVEMPISQNTILGEIDIMKNITLRSDGRYMGRKQIDGQIVTVYAHTTTECAAKLKKAIKEALKYPKKKKVNYNLHEWLDSWYSTYKEPFLKYKSAQNIKNIISIIKDKINNCKLSELTTSSIQKFLNGFEPSRKKEFLELYINAALQKAEDLDYIEKNPCKSVVKSARLKNIREPFNLAEQKDILQAIKGNEIEALIYFYLCTGIRKNELTTFNIDTDLDEKNHLIKIKSEKKRNGKNQYRLIDITNKMILLIKRNKEKFNLKTDYVYRKFKDILKDLKIEGGLHNLRHTFATNHYYLGTPAKQVQEWLGHETIDLTQNIYTHIDRTITKADILKLYNNLYYRV